MNSSSLLGTEWENRQTAVRTFDHQKSVTIMKSHLSDRFFLLLLLIGQLAVPANAETPTIPVTPDRWGHRHTRQPSTRCCADLNASGTARPAGEPRDQEPAEGR